MTMSDSERLVECYILHVRKYRDTSVIAELLTAAEGRVSVVMRGVRGKRSRVAGHIQPFTHFLMSWFGRGELKTAKSMDFPYASINLSGEALMIGLYVNELLVRLLGKFEAVPSAFSAYGALLGDLSNENHRLQSLRTFEVMLLRELGYGITFEWEAETGEPISAQKWYRYNPDEGFHHVREVGASGTYSGEHLLAIADGSLEQPEIEASLRRIVRSSFANLLGERQLRSRELFRLPGDTA